MGFGRPKGSISHSNPGKEACKSYMREEHSHPTVPLPEGTRLPNRPTGPGGCSVPVTSDHQGRSLTAEEGDTPQALGGRRRWRSEDETIGYQPIVVGTEITDRVGRAIHPDFPASRITDHMPFRSRGSGQSRIPSPTRIITKKGHGERDSRETNQPRCISNIRPRLPRITPQMGISCGAPTSREEREVSSGRPR